MAPHNLAVKATDTPEAPDLTSVRALRDEWLVSLRAGNYAPRTLETYGDASRFFADFLEAKGMPTEPSKLTREHVEAFLIDQLETRQASTVSVRFRALQQFFGWLIEEGEVPEETNPIRNVKGPKVPEKPVPVVDAQVVKAMLKTCGARDFQDIRDAAIIRVLYDSGPRRGALESMTVESFRPEVGSIRVYKKGQGEMDLPVGDKTLQALARYMRARARHKYHFLPNLWIGQNGAMTGSGVYQVIEARADKAGVPRIHPHQLRHTAAHQLRLRGMGDAELMRVMGWKSRSMLSRYSASVADERAREAHRRLSPGNDI